MKFCEDDECYSDSSQDEPATYGPVASVLDGETADDDEGVTNNDCAGISDENEVEAVKMRGQ